MKIIEKLLFTILGMIVAVVIFILVCANNPALSGTVGKDVNEYAATHASSSEETTIATSTQ